MERRGRRLSNSHCVQLCAQLRKPSERREDHRARDAIPARRADHVLYMPERMVALLARRVTNTRADANDANADDASGVVAPGASDYSRWVTAPPRWSPAHQCVLQCSGLQAGHLASYAACATWSPDSYGSWALVGMCIACVGEQGGARVVACVRVDSRAGRGARGPPGERRPAELPRDVFARAGMTSRLFVRGRVTQVLKSSRRDELAMLQTPERSTIFQYRLHKC